MAHTVPLHAVGIVETRGTKNGVATKITISSECVVKQLLI